MQKIKSTFPGMVIALTIITLVAAAVLAGVYVLTCEPIALAQQLKQQRAERAVLAGAEGRAVVAEADGFGGTMQVMVGFAPDATILGYEVLSHQETPGLGDKSTEWFRQSDKPGQCIVGRRATGAFAVSKDGGDVDAITAATISSRAFLRAVNAAYAEWAAGQGLSADSCEASTGASEQWHEADSVVSSQEMEVTHE